MDAIAVFLLNIIGIINSVLVPLVFSLAFLLFLWGVFQYFISGATNEEKRDEGKKFVMWGIIGFVLMFSIWGIVNLIINSLGFDTRTRPQLPLFGPAVGYGTPYAQQGTFGQGNPNAGPGCSIFNAWLCPGPRTGPNGEQIPGLDCRQGTCVNVDGD